ncbi:hypothetical protein NFI96_003390 [Prochilodus magdalenae]|nr:hypothetical protein NFI96_003390 [Prochilodus magdalenae]
MSVGPYRFLEHHGAAPLLLHLLELLLNSSVSVNDLVAVGVDSFYASNDHYFNNHQLQLLETLISLTWYLYVSDIFRHRIAVMEIQKDNTLSHVKDVAVGTIPDNIEVDSETGDLWIGCHPNGLKFLLDDKNDPPGSEVIRIQNIHSEEPVVTQVYADDGGVLIGSSVAARYREKLLIGTVYHKTLCCDLN